MRMTGNDSRVCEWTEWGRCLISFHLSILNEVGYCKSRRANKLRIKLAKVCVKGYHIIHYTHIDQRQIKKLYGNGKSWSAGRVWHEAYHASTVSYMIKRAQLQYDVLVTLFLLYTVHTVVFNLFHIKVHSLFVIGAMDHHSMRHSLSNRRPRIFCYCNLWNKFHAIFHFTLPWV